MFKVEFDQLDENLSSGMFTGNVRTGKDFLNGLPVA